MYDLKAPGRDYDQLYKALKSYGTWAKITESAWAIVTDSSARLIRNHLGSFLDNNDRLFVIKSGQNAAWRNVIGSSEWFKNHLNKI
jgi:hypothetical protein